MSLRRTAALIICLTFSGLFAVLYAISSSNLRAGFSTLEREEVEEEITRAGRVLHGETEALEATVADWAMWDDTYRFARDRDADYLRGNINFQSLSTIHADLILIYDAAGSLVLGRTVQAADQKLLPVSRALSDKVAATRLVARPGKNGNVVSGMLIEGGTVWLLAACPILTSTREGPPHGVLVMGRRLDADNIAGLSELIMLRLGVVDLQQPGLSPRFGDIAASIGRTGRHAVVPDGEKSIQGFALLRDLAGRPGILLSVAMPRRIFAQERIVQRNNVMFLLTIGLAFGLAMMLLVERRILSRVSSLRGQIKHLGEDTAGEGRTFVAGNDEIADLSKAINAMLAALDQAHGRYAMATRAAKVGVWELWKESGAFYIDPHFLALLDYNAEGMRPELDAWLAHVHPEDRERVREELAAWTKGDVDEYVGEQRMSARDGTVHWILVRGRAVRDASGRATRFVGTNTDVTELKQAEENIRKLTGALLKAQEIERARIARDLHDNVAQDLSAAKIACQTLLDGTALPSPAVRDRLTGFTALLSRAIRSVRELSYGLRPPDLEYLGLVQALERLCDDFSRQAAMGVDFVSSGLEGVSVPQDVAINLYRVAQEALANVRRHAGARHVSVRLVESYPRLILRVKDDGKGFNVAEGLDRAGRDRRMGLAGMRERVGLFGGTLRIASQPGQGCLVVAEVVYVEERQHGNEADTDR
ncbi:multi-sensor signal transduction histidine kinase [Solidesulfovibrio fructosivorans JJ]]|uniref:Multi-sensor signal transduction histidine kinase n=1 Tax=Solidesulfovibrio fructosivorans JJ] TaxID=596151 RepID=E1JTP7_SOLFR|nr:CHASE4 domain-containing protein [Solidesulfovibrio fructosivorans]EFL52176.1 multi-sensor signal transduction histidine kinase [Solidesulfovibrio fructosivorans JJ]]